MAAGGSPQRAGAPRADRDQVTPREADPIVFGTAKPGGGITNPNGLHRDETNQLRSCEPCGVRWRGGPDCWAPNHSQ